MMIDEMYMCVGFSTIHVVQTKEYSETRTGKCECFVVIGCSPNADSVCQEVEHKSIRPSKNPVFDSPIHTSAASYNNRKSGSVENN